MVLPMVVEPADCARIQAQLDKILRSALFVQSERLCQFLRFAVDTTLRGEADQLKESIVGVKVYGRDPGYDPKLEPIVRTEARRLRAKLKQYYEGPGEADRVLISLPTGGYSIHFEILPESVLTAGPIGVQAPPSSRRERTHIVSIVALAALLVVSGVAIDFLYFRPEQAKAPTVIPVATYPGDEFEPSVSPDGKRVAFVWDQSPGRFNIYLKGLGSENASRLTDSASPTHDLYPAWSPDGKSVAYVTVSPGKKELFIRAASGGNARRIAEFYTSLPSWQPDASIMDWSPGPAWSRDGKSLALTDRVNGGHSDAIYLIDLENGGQSRLTSPSASDVGDYAPAFSPDGSRLAFVRLASQRGISDIHVLSLKDRSEKRRS